MKNSNTAFAWSCMILGIAMIASASMLLAHITHKVDGVVLDRELYTNNLGGTCISIKYQYSYADHDYKGNDIIPFTFADQNVTIGSRISIFIDSSSPSTSRLSQKGPESSIAGIGAGAFLFLVGGVTFFGRLK